jgi:hypothetical protein
LQRGGLTLLPAEPLLPILRIISISETLSSRIPRLFRVLLQITSDAELQGECHADAVLVAPDIYERGSRA